LSEHFIYIPNAIITIAAVVVIISNDCKYESPPLPLPRTKQRSLRCLKQRTRRAKGHQQQQQQQQQSSSFRSS
jgi:hypothetical protein